MDQPQNDDCLILNIWGPQGPPWPDARSRLVARRRLLRPVPIAQFGVASEVARSAKQAIPRLRTVDGTRRKSREGTQRPSHLAHVGFVD